MKVPLAAAAFLNVGLAGLQALASPVVDHNRGKVVEASDFPIAPGLSARDEMHYFAKRGVSAENTCRSVTQNDLASLSDANLQLLMNNANTLFNFPVTSTATPRTYRSDMFSGTTYGGWNAKLSILRSQDVVQYGQNKASVCLDGEAASVAFNSDSSSCSKSTIDTYGTSMTTGSTIAITVGQGYSIATTVSTESSSGQTFESSAGTDNTVTSESESSDENQLGGASETGFKFSLFGNEVSEAITIAYDHVWGSSSTNGRETTSSGSVTSGSETGYSSGTEVLSQQDFTNSIAITVSPPAGYTCYVSVGVSTCKGSAVVTSPITYPSGMVLFDFGDYPACLATDPNCSAGTFQYFYVPINTLLNGFTPNYVVDTLNVAVKANGKYSEHCDAPTTITGTNGTGTASTANPLYTPTLTCPKNLGVKKGCQVQMEDYLGEGIVTGDTGVWSSNAVSYVQDAGPGTNVTFGQKTINFQASTPYQTASCSALLQVVPDYSATFSPAQNQLAFPQDGSDLVGASYLVGYVASCGDDQYGTCAIKGISSQNTPSFTWTQTSPKGNPNAVFTFSNNGQGWPENDVLTFNVQCSDVYGSSGGIQSFQQAYRNDIATATVTANTATNTFHSTTKYLYSSVKTLYTSMITPVATVDLNTQTLYIATTYTGTQTIPGYGAKSVFGGTVTTTTTATTRPRVTVSSTTTYYPATPTSTSVITAPPKSTVTAFTTLKANSTTVLKVPTVTATDTKTLCGVVLPPGSPIPSSTTSSGAAVAKFAAAPTSTASVSSSTSTAKTSTASTSTAKPSSSSTSTAKTATTSTSTGSSSTKTSTSTTVVKRAEATPAAALEDRAIRSTTTVIDNSRTYTVTDYTRTGTITDAGTLISTDLVNWATSTLKTTSTVYEPYKTQYVFATLTTASTKTETRRYTGYSTATRTTTVTSPVTNIALVSKTAAQVTVRSTSYLPNPTTTSTITPATVTYTTAISTATVTTVSTKSLAYCTQPAVKA